MRNASLAALAASPLSALAQEPSSFEKIKARGSLIVAVYQELPPFHVKGKGIEVELAQALADGVGLKLSLMPFAAGEEMSDDLRNMVWRGHYLGFGPADVMLHVPVERPFIQAQRQVQIFGPYWRESVMIARDLSKVPKFESLSDLRGQKIAVPGQSTAGWLMIGAENGAYREQLSTKHEDGVQAAQWLLRGEVAAVAAYRSELQFALKDDKRFAIEPFPQQDAPRSSWAVGMAVKRDATDLARALQASLNSIIEKGQIKQMFANHNVIWQPA